MTLREKQQQLLCQLTPMHDAQERFSWLVEQARLRPLLDPAQRIDAFRIDGCLARLWLVPEFDRGVCRFRCDSDSLVVKAVAGLLCDFYSDRTPAEIILHPPEFLSTLGIGRHLTPNRRNGLSHVWEQIRTFAELHHDNQAPTPSLP